MLYIDNIILHNFKSFRHASIKFNKGFNCIVGPNYSGKSNICDALLFAFGESSLSRMRVTSTLQLINSSARPRKEDGTKRAYVKVNFAGEEPLEISRVIKSNNKIVYRLNGKRVTRQDVIDTLRTKKSEINETNTIAQGEIQSMLKLNSKERRELIDVAAGIKEYNDKKTAALKELEKVQNKINEAQILLNERTGFLTDLQKEKEDTERYMALTNQVKRINYTISKIREQSLISEYEKVLVFLQNKKQEQDTLKTKISAIDSEVEKLSKEKETLVKGLNERSIEVGSTNRLLEEVNKNIAVKEAEEKSIKEKITEINSHNTELKGELDGISKEILKNQETLEKLENELKEKSKNLVNFDIEESGESKEAKLFVDYGSNLKRIDEFELENDNLTNIYLKKTFELDNIQKVAEDIKEQLKILDQEQSSKRIILEDRNKGISGIREKLSKENDALKAALAAMQENEKLFDKITSEILSLKEQIMLYGGASERVTEVLKSNLYSGFYGRAYELCSYDENYAVAVHAAAGTRLNYFVVESIEVANSAIKILKNKNLGRASFIPIKDIVVRPTNQEKGLAPLISKINFDEKYEATFQYIFSNTYIIDSIDNVKKIKSGKYRFVTLEGELIEQSGIVTGGAIKLSHTPAILESKTRRLEEDKKLILSQLSESSLIVEKLRKNIAAYQTEELSFNLELKHLQPHLEENENKTKQLSDKLDILQNQLEDLKRYIQESKDKRDRVTDELSKLKAENSRLYSATTSILSVKGKIKKSKSELSKIKVLQNEIESLKMNITTKSTENKMLSNRTKDIQKETEKENQDLKEKSKNLAKLENELAETKKTKSDLQEKIKGHDTKSNTLLKQSIEMDSKLTSLSLEKGKFLNQFDKLDRELIDSESNKKQLETRINDTKAELLSYPNQEMVENKKPEELEKELIKTKIELENLGPVNLKAPETYELRKKDVKTAQEQLSVIENEKFSIIGMINEIESKKLNVFVQTMDIVNENFKKLYNNIFDGLASLYLEDPKDPFNSGLHVKITTQKKTERLFDQLSGGEKSLLMLMLIFAIQMRNPMSFYIFDEIDTSLDKENSKKLSKLIKQLGKESQIVVVSHNDSLISAADTAIGVVIRNEESEVVGLQFTPQEEIKEIA